MRCRPFYATACALLIACTAALPVRAQVTDAGMLPKPNIPHDWHTYIYAAHRSGGTGTGAAVTARADVWAGQWGGALGIGAVADTAGQWDLALGIALMHSLIDAGNSFDAVGVQLHTGLSSRADPAGAVVDTRAGVGVIMRSSPLFISGQLWLNFDVLGHDITDTAVLRGGVGAGVRVTLHRYLPRLGVQTHLRLGVDEGAALEFGLHYSTS